jgi:cytidine deaminase
MRRPIVTFEPSELLAAAVAARDRAYAPYSGFFVGAALATPDGRVFTGANIENASYGLSMCAERVAIYHALSSGAERFDAVAVSGPDGVLTMPCGACRQVLHEFGPAMQVVVAEGGQLRVTPLSALLPEAFGASVLDAVAAGGGSPGRGAR